MNKSSLLFVLLTVSLFLGTTPSSLLGQTTFLSQNWTEAERQEFYTTSQGSRMMPYAWFMALETHDGQDLFFEKTLPTLGYLPNAKSDTNPDALPVGFVKDIDASMNQHVGLNCSACHTSQISFEGKRLQIDGGATLGDLWGMIEGIDKALSETRFDEAKFERFAQRVLQTDAGSSRKKKELRSELTQFTDYWNRLTIDSRVTHPWGRARADAFGMIFNRVSAIDLGIPENSKKPDAPVSYPFLWGTSFEDKVQWNGSAENANDIERLGRNVGEVLGVFGQAEFTVRFKKIIARTSAKRLNQVKLENLLKKLWSPQWPSDLSPIDSMKAAAGEVLFDSNCVKCHTLIKHGDQSKPVTVTMTPLTDVETDPKMAVNAATGTVSTGKLRRAEGFRRRMPRGELLQKLVRASIISPFRDVRQGDGLLDSIFDLRNRGIRDNVFDPSEIKAFVAALDVDTEDQAQKLVEKFAGKLESYYDDLAKAEKWMKSRDVESITSESTGTSESPPALSYKARPLDGIWATAPYLHNGSVPNLYELVSPRHERTKTFHVGSMDFDPIKVGFKTDAAEGTSEFDTSLPGNSNAGHDMYGTFTEEQRWQLVEYMKTL